jgi:Flp pilus assembly protein TadD
MLRFATVLVLGALLVGLVACGASSGPKPSTTAAQAAPYPAPATSAAAASPTTAP